MVGNIGILVSDVRGMRMLPSRQILQFFCSGAFATAQLGNVENLAIKMS